MKTKNSQGRFEVIQSFGIRRRSEFYLLGQLTEGIIQEQWFLNVPLNSSLSMTLRITSIEDVETADEQKQYKLVVVSAEEDALTLLLGFGIGNEVLDITVEGED